MKLNFVTLDVFTASRFAGNQLAIVTIPSDLVSSITYEQKRQIAKEFNLAETVFVLEPSDKNASDIPVNIFLPSQEIPFAGHPTIGTGIYLIKFQNRGVKAIIPMTGRIGLDFDVATNTVSASIPHDVHLDSHTAAVQFGLPAPPQNVIFSIVKGMSFILAPLPNVGALAAAKCSFDDPAELDEGWGGFRGTKYYVDQGTDEQGFRLLRTRMHGASDDAVEDAATGSASCALASFLALQAPASQGAGPFKFHIVQGVEMGRPSDIYVDIVRTIDGKGIESVILRGTAVKVMEGSIELN